MQKALRRTELAVSQAARKARLLAAAEATRDRWRHRSETAILLAERHMAAKRSRSSRREAHELGPLAPWRNGPHTAAQQPYGTWHTRQMNPPNVPVGMRVKDWFVRAGDRVCVVKGPEGVRGRIGKVVSCSVETETLRVQGVNLIDVRLPPPLQQPGQPTFSTTEAPIPLSHVQLVYPLPDPLTGIPRDALLTTLTKREAYFDVYRNEEVWQRYLSPQHIRIPWPPRAEPEHADTPSDTLRQAVDEQSWLPTLLRPPMPGGVLDELRGRYSAFRDRHDEAWVAKKKAEDALADRRGKMASAMVPRAARNIARTGFAAAGKTGQLQKPPPRLRNDVLETIGRHMAEHQARGRATKVVAL